MFFIPSIYKAYDKHSPVLAVIKRNQMGLTTALESSNFRAQQSFNNLNPAISDTSKELMSYAKTALIAGAILSGGAFSVKAIADYETELANLKSLTGKSGAEFDVFKGKIKDVAGQTRSSAIEVTKAFAAIANNQPALLENADALAAVTQSSIILAQAAKMELGPAGEALTQILNQYGKGAEYAARATDILAAGSVAGSSEISDSAAAIQKFGTVAANAGVKIDESVALIELASKFEKGADAGVKLRNILLAMSTAKVLDPTARKDLRRLHVDLGVVSNAALPLRVRLREMAKIAKDDAALFHVFGKENQALATGVLATAGNFDKMLGSINEVGRAQEMARINNDTFTKGVERLKNKFITWLVTSDEAAKSLSIMKDAVGWVTDNMSGLMRIVGYTAGIWLAYKSTVIASAIWTGIQSAALGVSIAMNRGSALAVAGNTVATNAYKIALGMTTAAQYALNLAMSMNPVAATVLRVLALAAALGYVIKNYKSIEELHASQMSKRKTQGAEDEKKAVLDLARSYEKLGHSREYAQQKAVLVEKQNLVNELAYMKQKMAGAKNDGERRAVELNMASAEGKLAALNNSEAIFSEVNPKLAEQDAIMKYMESTKNANVNINIKDKHNSVDASSDDDFVSIFTSSTMKP